MPASAVLPTNTPSNAAVKELKLRLGTLKDSPSFVSPLPTKAVNTDGKNDAGILREMKQDIFKESAPSPLPDIGDSPFPGALNSDEEDARSQVKILNGKLKISQLMYDQVVSENLRVLRQKERVEQDLAEMKKKLSEKEGQSKSGMEQARKELDSFEQQFKPLCQELITVRKDLTKSNELLAEAEKENARLREESEKESAKRVEAEKENARQRAELVKMEAARADKAKAEELLQMEKLVNTLTEQNERLAAQLEATQELQRERDEYLKVSQELADEVLELKSEAEHQAESHRKECEVFESENTELRGRVADLSSELRAAHGQVKSCTDRIGELHSIQDRLVADIKDLEDRISALSDQLAAAESRKAALEKQNKQLAVDIPAKFQTKLEALQEQAFEAHAANERHVSKLQRRIEKRDSEVEHLRGVWRNLLVAHPDLDRVPEVAAGEIRQLMREKQRLQSSVDEAREENEGLVIMVAVQHLRLMLANWRRPVYYKTLRLRMSEARDMCEAEENGDEGVLQESLNERRDRIDHSLFLSSTSSMRSPRKQHLALTSYERSKNSMSPSAVYQQQQQQQQVYSGSPGVMVDDQQQAPLLWGVGDHVGNNGDGTQRSVGVDAESAVQEQQQHEGEGDSRVEDIRRMRALNEGRAKYKAAAAAAAAAEGTQRENSKSPKTVTIDWAPVTAKIATPPSPKELSPGGGTLYLNTDDSALFQVGGGLLQGGTGLTQGPYIPASMSRDASPGEMASRGGHEGAWRAARGEDAWGGTPHRVPDSLISPVVPMSGTMSHLSPEGGQLPGAFSTLITPGGGYEGARVAPTTAGSSLMMPPSPREGLLMADTPYVQTNSTPSFNASPLTGLFGAVQYDKKPTVALHAGDGAIDAQLAATRNLIPISPKGTDGSRPSDTVSSQSRDRDNVSRDQKLRRPSPEMVTPAGLTPSQAAVVSRMVNSAGRTDLFGTDGGKSSTNTPTTTTRTVSDYKAIAQKADAEIAALQYQAVKRQQEAKREADLLKAKADMAIARNQEEAARRRTLADASPATKEGTLRSASPLLLLGSRSTSPLPTIPDPSHIQVRPTPPLPLPSRAASPSIFDPAHVRGADTHVRASPLVPRAPSPSVFDPAHLRLSSGFPLAHRPQSPGLPPQSGGTRPGNSQGAAAASVSGGTRTGGIQPPTKAELLMGASPVYLHHQGNALDAAVSRTDIRQPQARATMSMQDGWGTLLGDEEGSIQHKGHSTNIYHVL